MKKTHAFRPTAFDHELETRVVPNAASAALHAVLHAERLAAFRDRLLARREHATKVAVPHVGNASSAVLTLHPATTPTTSGPVTTGAAIGARTLNTPLANLRFHLNTQFAGFGRPLVIEPPMTGISALNASRTITRPTSTTTTPTTSTGTTAASSTSTSSTTGSNTTTSSTTTGSTITNTGLGFFVTTDPNFGIGASTVGSPFNSPTSLSFNNGVGTVVGSTAGTTTTVGTGNTTGLTAVNNGFGTVPVSSNGTTTSGLGINISPAGSTPATTTSPGTVSGTFFTPSGMTITF